jgi:fructose-1,6-bisphosphatase I
MTEHRLTLTQHLLREVQSGAASGDIDAIIAEIATACKEARAQLAQVGLGPLAGMQGAINVQGEAVHKLDWFANNLFVEHFEGSGLLCSLISEELEEIHHFDDDCSSAGHTMCIDPMDGSSNLDVDGVVGTIFAIRRKASDEHHDKPSQVFHPGTEQLAAGYVLYGPQTMLVYAASGSVHGFTLDTAVGEFFLSHPDIRIPDCGSEFSGNLSRLAAWNSAFKTFVGHHSHGGDGEPYSLRYIGALVGDFHRILLRGGVFFYPGDAKNPNGKLRLLYEAAPLAHLAEAAGGSATDGAQRILEVVPSALHQRTPLVIGSRDEVNTIQSLLANAAPAAAASKGAG